MMTEFDSIVWKREQEEAIAAAGGIKPYGHHKNCPKCGHFLGLNGCRSQWDIDARDGCGFRHYGTEDKIRLKCRRCGGLFFEYVRDKIESKRHPGERPHCEELPDVVAGKFIKEPPFIVASDAPDTEVDRFGMECFSLLSYGIPLGILLGALSAIGVLVYQSCSP